MHRKEMNKRHSDADFESHEATKKDQIRHRGHQQPHRNNIKWPKSKQRRYVEDMPDKQWKLEEDTEESLKLANNVFQV